MTKPMYRWTNMTTAYRPGDRDLSAINRRMRHTWRRRLAVWMRGWR